MLRIVFMGTPDFAVPTLQEIIATGHEVVAVYTQPPRPAGRGMSARRSPVHQFADKVGIDVRTPKSLRPAPEQQAFAALNLDVAVVVAYGLILPKAILEAPTAGCLNLHGSALPRWRGAAPIQRAIMAGDSSTAATVMRMDEGLDTGPVCLSHITPIGPDMTAGELHDQMAEDGARLMVRALVALENGTLAETLQSEQGVTYAAKIDKAEAHIDFAKPASEVHNLIRGLSPFPGAWFEIDRRGRRERIKVLRSQLRGRSDRVARGADMPPAPGTIMDDHLTIACGDGSVRLTKVQRAGKRPMSAADFQRGTELPAGTLLF